MAHRARPDPRTLAALGNDRQHARMVAGQDAGEAGFGEFWIIAAVAAFALMAVEWYLYHHRVVV